MINPNYLPVGVGLCNRKYVIESMIGAGGFGITYKARNTYSGGYYAVKEFFVRGRCARNSQNHSVTTSEMKEESFAKYLDKFIEEGNLLTQFNHPNIVRVKEVFLENNTAYIVMEFVEGKTLQQTVKETGRLEYSLAVNFIAQLADAVNYTHSRNILHRDIKPENMIITPDYRVILIDFGAARMFAHDQTQRHTTIYTPGYAPLEQYSSTSRKGSYSDIYSMGATFYYAMTGQDPIDSAARNIDPMPSPRELFPDIPEEADRTVMKAMQMESKNRHQSVPEFMNDLLNRQEEVTAKPQAQMPKMLTIGRHGDNNIVINDEKASRWHLQIVQESSGNFHLMDLNSANGTFVNGRSVMEANIKSGDVVQIGNTILPWESYFINIWAQTAMEAQNQTPEQSLQTVKTSTTRLPEEPAQKQKTGFFKRIWKAIMNKE